MGNWAIIVPETAEVTNLVTNPSGERNTKSEYAAVAGGSLDPKVEFGNQRRGAYAFEYTPTSTTGDGVYYGPVTLTSGVNYTFSLDVKGVLGVPYKIYFAATDTTALGTPTTFTGTGEWQRVSVTYAETGTNSRRLYITKNSSASVAPYWFDGLMCVALGYEIEYFDGDSPGARWTGAKHASTSVLDPQQRQGGREINFSTYEVSVLAEQGIGMPAAEHLTINQALLPGASFQGRKVLPRTVNLRCQMKGVDWDGLHSLRKDLIDVIKPDLVSGDQAFILRYYGANSGKPLDLYAVYDSGLEMGNPEMYLDEFNLRVIAYDPFWYDTYDTAYPLPSYSGPTYRYFGGKRNGDWAFIAPSAMTDPGTGILVRTICVGKKSGRIYVGGRFLNGDGQANCDYIMQFDPNSGVGTGTWYPLGSGTNGYVRSIVEAPDGSIYVGGEFTSAGGVANTAYIAKWNAMDVSPAWTALGTGMNGIVYGLAISPDGSLYAAGDFTTANGVACTRIAKWNGTTFAALGSGLDNEGVDIDFDQAGNLYVGGSFSLAGGIAGTAYIAKWDGSAWTPLGTGFNNLVYDIEFGPDGLLYAGGAFTTADGSPAAYIAKWNGTSWAPLGDGVSGGSIYAVSIDAGGLVYAGGAFTSAGGLSLADRVAVWNGSTWAHLDIDLPGSATVYELLTDGEDIYLGFDTSGQVYASHQYTINNPGTETAYPTLKVHWESTGTQVRLEYLRNNDTGATIWLDYALQIGETVEIDFAPGRRSIQSDYNGSIWRAILRGSDFGEFGLLPRDNRVSLYISEAGTPVYTANMIWQPAYWSADGAAV